MILTIIIALIISFIASVRFSARILSRLHQAYYGRFIVINFLLLISAIATIYYISRNDEKPVRFLLLSLSFLSIQIIAVLIIGWVVRNISAKRGLYKEA